MKSLTLQQPPPKIYDEVVNDERKLTQPWQDWISALQIAVNQMIGTQALGSQNSVFSVVQNIAPGPVYQLIFTATFKDGMTKSYTQTLT